MGAPKRPPKAPLTELIVDTPSTAEDAVASLAKIRAAKAQIKQDNLIFFFKPGDIWWPNPLQKQLLDAWQELMYKVFVFAGSNRLGKCVTYQTLIETPDGEKTVGELYDLGKPFDVYAWDGEKRVIAKATAPFKKDGLHLCYRITMSDGRWVEAADHHRVLCADGSYHTVAMLAAAFLSYPPRTSSSLQLIESITPIDARQEVYDFTVEKHHNYFAGGLIHHNTTIGVILSYVTMFGEWPWSGEKLVFPHKDPRLILYVGQGWETHIQKVVEPELIRLWPKSRGAVSDVTKKNNQGIRAFWEDPVTHSQLHIGSNNQESDAFEGPKWDLIVWDEPPDRNKRVAAARGLVDRSGRELFVATLVKEAWVHKEVIKARDENGNPDFSVFQVDGDIYTNVSRCNCGAYIQRTVTRDDKVIVGICEEHGEQEDFDRRGLTLEGVNQFAKTLRKDEKEARLFGRPAYLADLVLKNFDRNHNCRPRLANIPLNWIFDVSIDFHPAKPWAVLFMGTDKKNFKYVTDRLELRGGPNAVGDAIVRFIQDKKMYVNSITIDPLSKGDCNAHEADEASTTFAKLEAKLAAYGYCLEVASKNKTAGIDATNDLLFTENEMASLFFFDDLGDVIEQVESWMLDPDTLLPSKKDPDEWCELLYRLVLKGTQWFDHRGAEESIYPSNRDEEEYDPLGRR